MILQIDYIIVISIEKWGAIIVIIIIMSNLWYVHVETHLFTSTLSCHLQWASPLQEYISSRDIKQEQNRP